MPTLRIPPGVIVSDTKASVLGRWNRTNLVRWSNGRMEPVGGWNRSTRMPLAVPARNAIVWLDNQYRRNSAYIGNGKIYRELDNTYTDITPGDFLGSGTAYTRQGFGTEKFGADLFGTDTGGAQLAKTANYFPIRYGLENWGEQLLFMSSTDGRVFVWNPADGTTKQAVGLPGNQIQDILVTEERHLVLLGYAGMPNRVAWSEQEDRENFDFTNVTGSAGFQDLESAGQLLTARRIQGGVLIFSTTSVYLMTYIGSPYIHSIKKIADGCTPVSPQAVTSFADKCFWMGAKGFFVYANGTVQPLPCTLGDDVFLNMDVVSAEKYVCAGMNYAFPEVWFFYPRMSNLSINDNTNYVIYNFVENWWANGTLARSCFVGSSIDNKPVAGGLDGNIFQHEEGYLDNGVTRIDDVWAEATASFDDAGNVYSLTQGQVDTGNTDPRSIKFDINARVTRNGQSYPKGPFIARKDGKIDMRFTASDFDFRVSALVDGLWALGAMITDAKPRGPR